MVRFNILKFIGMFAILAMVCLAAPPGAMASDGTAGDGGSTFVKPDPGDIVALDSSVPVDGVGKIDPTDYPVAYEEHGFLTASVAKGGDATASGSEPSANHRTDII